MLIHKISLLIAPIFQGNKKGIFPYLYHFSKIIFPILRYSNPLILSPDSHNTFLQWHHLLTHFSWLLHFSKMSPIPTSLFKPEHKTPMISPFCPYVTVQLGTWIISQIHSNSPPPHHYQSTLSLRKCYLLPRLLKYHLVLFNLSCYFFFISVCQ
jgi:hypothetical protein